jgi:hypothetical protein
VQHGQIGAGHALIFALPSHPSGVARKRAAQRLDLPDLTTLAVTVFVEAEQPLAAHEGFEQLRFRRHQLDLHGVALAHFVDEAIRLGVQAPSVQAEHRKRQPELARHVNQHDVFGAAERDGAVGLKAPERLAQDLHWILLVETASHGVD